MQCTLSLYLLALSYSPLPSRPHAANCGIEMREWRCEKEWVPGCANPAYRFLLAARARDQFTQLRVHFYAHLCTYLVRVLICVFLNQSGKCLQMLFLVSFKSQSETPLLPRQIMHSHAIFCIIACTAISTNTRVLSQYLVKMQLLQLSAIWIWIIDRDVKISTLRKCERSGCSQTSFNSQIQSTGNDILAFAVLTFWYRDRKGLFRYLSLFLTIFMFAERRMPSNRAARHEIDWRRTRECGGTFYKATVLSEGRPHESNVHHGHGPSNIGFSWSSHIEVWVTSNCWQHVVILIIFWRTWIWWKA